MNENKILIIGSSGYIGSFLSYNLTNSYTVDIGWFDANEPNLKIDYKNLTSDILKNFSHIILLAGHSSVKMCVDYHSAWNNNVVNFTNLIGKLNENQTLIYASSGSVYGKKGINCNENTTLPAASIEYDLSKQIIEKIAIGAKCKTIGLRFGTVNGFNFNMRSDLLLNALTKNAVENKVINCYNGSDFRSILGLNDLLISIHILINNTHMLGHHEIFNLSSFFGSIEEFSTLIAKYFNVPIVFHDQNTSNFSFTLDCNKFCNLFNFKFKDNPNLLIEQIIKNYEKIKWTDRYKEIYYV